MRHFIGIALFIACVSVNAQTYIEFQAGGATYGFNDLKTWQEDIANSSEFNLSVVESFPLYGAFQGSLLFNSGDYYFGGGISYYSTGGRMGYWDDTGSIIEDQLIEKFGGHIISSYTVLEKGKFLFDIRSSVAFNLTSLTLLSSFTIGQESLTQETGLSSMNVTFLPSADLKYELSNNFGLGLSLGGEIEFFKQQLLFDENKDVALGLTDGSTFVKHGWTGLRVLGGIYMKIPKK